MTLALIDPVQATPAARDETNSGDTDLGFAKTTVLALTSMTAATGLLCHPVIGSADFATSSPPFLVSEQPTRQANVWTSAAPSAAEVADEPAVVSHSDREEVLWVKENSGLTWDQLGKVFGVSRRAVHMWANGGRMNESNSRTLHDFGAEVRRYLQGTPDATRTALLSHGAGDLSIVEQFRTRNVVPAGESWGSPFTVDEKVEEQLRHLDRES